MIINANDRYIGRSIEQFGSWAADDIELIKSIIEIQLQENTHVNFYDVGANIGTHSVALARHFGSKISVRSFEAQRQLFYMLCGNVAINGLPNVWCQHCAVSDGSSNSLQVTLPDYNQQNNFGGFELIKAANSDNDFMSTDQTETVPCVTIDQFKEKVHFIKLDIEGMEYLALSGATKTIAQNQPICFVEVLKSDKEQIKKFFHDLDYIGYAYKQDDWIFVHKHSDVELDLPILLH